MKLNKNKFPLIVLFHCLIFISANVWAADPYLTGNDYIAIPPKSKAETAPTIEELAKQAEGGDAMAQFKLGKAYMKGVSVPQHFGEARQWFLRAAKQGYAPAMLEMAMLYQYGKGGRKELSRAYYWYTLAAANGVKVAVPRRDRLLWKIGPKEAEKAQDEALKFKPRPERGAKP